MEKEFVPYEQALRMKQLGFDEPCFAWYVTESYGLEYGKVIKSDLIKDGIVAPTFSQAFRWFREKHYLYAIIIPTITMHWTFKTTTVVEGMVEVPPYNHVHAIDYSTYEEAELACLACLEKLIEIKQTFKSE